MLVITSKLNLYNRKEFKSIMETIYIRTSWDRQTKKGLWSASAGTQQFFGSASDTTDQRLQLTALIEAINSLPRYYYKTQVRLSAPKQYVTHAMTNFKAWQRQGRLAQRLNPTKYDGRPVTNGGNYVANLDLWEQLIKAGNAHNIELIWEGK